jgi:hypothetical protein
MIRRKSLIWLALVGLGLSLIMAALFHFFPFFAGSWQFDERSAQTHLNTSSTHLETSIPPTAVDAAYYGAGLQRTMNLLSHSTSERPNTVRILFYGQSITRQPWWLDVETDLRQRFPSANLIVENRAIGGFDSEKLVRTAEHDLYSFYPDLMIFHVYGNERAYESIIANARRRTTTEVLLISDHITWLPGSASDSNSRLKEYEWHNRHSLQWLPQIANQYGCELAEIRRPWEQHLRSNHLPASTMLSDNIHLNEQGNALMADLIKTHLQNVPIASEIPSNPVQIYAVGTDVQWQQNQLTLEFDGNRVDLIADDSIASDTGTEVNPSNAFGFAKILIDGQLPSSFPDLYAITRPTDALGVDQPALIQVSATRPLIPERWTTVISEIDETCDRFRFKVYGSETGFDGEGQNDRPFVSQSGRVVINPEDWWLDDACHMTEMSVPVGFQIYWQVKPLFTNVYVSPSNLSAPNGAVTIAQNLSNTKHTLEIVSNGEALPIREIRTYHPSLS